jgi:hypothetical protein
MKLEYPALSFMAKKKIQINNHQFQVFQELQRQHMPVFMKNLAINKFFFWGCYLMFLQEKLIEVLGMYFDFVSNH